MKKYLFFAASLALLASCASDELVDTSVPGAAGVNQSPITFVTSQKNSTRAQKLNEAGHYNFGVFAYKSTDKENNVMANYLVGYYDESNAYQKAGTTWGDGAGLVDGKSYWMYEGMGYAEYNGTYAGKAITTEYKSNVPNQYLKYWDNSADYTCFYAYAPYINNGFMPTATYVDGTAVGSSSDTYVLTIPNGTLKAGYDDPSLAEYMYASAKIAKANYGHDVALQFKRLNAKVNIKFWEDVPGYKVRILDLSSSASGVQAAASIKDDESGRYGYKGGKYYTSNGAKIQFHLMDATPSDNATVLQYDGTIATNTTPLVFKSPTDAQIGETRYTASPSATSYYAIPKGQGALVSGTEDTDIAITGFTFHVTYELTAEDSGERIVVKNATAHVPFTYCNWVQNTHYTYIFKITANTNGSTEPNPDIDPTDPEVPTVEALYPIVFDNCTVEEWIENESEWIISEGDYKATYHDVQLSPAKIVKGGTITVTVTDEDDYTGHRIDYSKIAVTGPQDASTWYDAETKTITVPNDATAGTYTVTYTCDAPAAAKPNHPKTWTETFVVTNAYAVTTHLTEIGCKSTVAEAKLNITTTKDGVSVTPTAGQLSIHYPDNFTAEQKANVYVDGTNVVVKSVATPGAYKLEYKVDGVVVDDQIFTVKDYSFALSHTIVSLGDAPVVINATVPTTGVISMPTTTGITVDDAAKTITVANTCAEGTYTVTYTVQGDNDAKTVYTQTFTVKNAHTVALSKTTIDRNEGATGSMEIGTDFIDITTTVNGAATTETQVAALKVITAAGDEVAATDAPITFVSGNTHKLQVKTTLATGTYKVVYTKNVAGSPVEVFATFEVQD